VADFYRDHNVARELADRLRDAGHGARTARELAMERAGDEAHLSLAAQSGRILITHNAKDFSLLHAAWQRWSADWKTSAHHAGILVLIPPVSPEEATREIESLVEASHTSQRLQVHRLHPAYDHGIMSNNECYMSSVSWGRRV
jgi:hypothetical protein